MADSSDHPNPKESSSSPPPPSPPPSSSSSSSSSNQRSNRPGTKRLFLTLSVLFSFLSGLPFLLKSTEIYRSPLPFASIASLSSRLHAQPPSFPCRFHTVFLQSKSHSDPDRLSAAISQHLDSKTSADRFCGGCGKNHSVAVTVESVAEKCISNSGAVSLWRCGAVNADAFGADDEAVDELLEEVIGTGESGGDGFGRLYTVVVVEKVIRFMPNSKLLLLSYMKLGSMFERCAE